MRKQLLTILGLLLAITVCNDAIAQRAVRNSPRAKKKFASGTPTPGNENCLHVLQINMIQEFDVNSVPDIPLGAKITIQKVAEGESVPTIEVITIPNFVYQHIDYMNGIMKHSIDVLPLCDYDPRYFAGYHTYQVTIEAYFADQSVSKTIVDMISNGQLVDNLIHESVTYPTLIASFIGSPNPFSEELTIEYQLMQDVDAASLVITDAQGNVGVNLQEALETSQGTHNIPFNTYNWPRGSYYATLTVIKNGETESRVITLLKN